MFQTFFRVDMIRLLVVLSMTFSTFLSVSAEIFGRASVDSFRGSIPVTSWKSLRDSRIVKQDLDYSCGAASLATVLNEFYGLSISEQMILEIMDKRDMRASFDDMADALRKLGFLGVGYAASFDQLTRLKMPVVVYMKYRKDDHFSVLRGISSDTVWLADPSMGNRTYSKHQFLEMWETRGDSDLKGKILAVIPQGQQVQVVDDFFTKQPRRQTAQAVQQKALQVLR